jgi:hypothetical protein
MNQPIAFEVYDGYACFRPSGQVTFHEAVGVIANAISEAVGQGIRCLLVDTINLRGFPHPTTSERYFMAEQWAARSRGLRLAVVARSEIIDPPRFGTMVARNRGLFAQVFDSEPEAIAWLLHPNPD